jgi:cysteine desulfurase/selenocysteine lyase
MFHVERARGEFPTLAQRVHGHALNYLDSAASALKPRAVIDAVASAYLEAPGNPHRGVHTLAARATDVLERARARVAASIGARAAHEVVLTRGATESLNLVAQGWALPRLGPGDEVLVTELEHHANRVPWQWACERSGARLVVAPIEDDGGVSAATVQRLLSSRTRVVAIAHLSNVLGSVLPVREIADHAHAVGALVVVDGAQAVPHLPVDVLALGADCYAFSAHKLYGPTGLGVLWARAEVLEQTRPLVGGGGMVREVTAERIELAPPPRRFEAGTPHVAGAAGLHAAIDFLASLGPLAIQAHEHALLVHAREALRAVDGVRVLGDPQEQAALLSFVVDGVHAHDVGTLLDRQGIAVRTGHHCAAPLMQRLGVAATVRASFGLYNTHAEVDALARAVHHAAERLR